jgi:acyl carrier protein
MGTVTRRDPFFIGSRQELRQRYHEVMSDEATNEGPAASAPIEMPEELRARVIKVIAKTQRIPPETVSIDSTFEELKIDSLDGINIIFALESEFNVDINDEDARSIKSVRQMAQGIALLIAQKGSAL